jgi:hypothetical protein
MWWLREHRTAIVTVHSIVYHHLDTERNEIEIVSSDIFSFPTIIIIVIEYVLFNEFHFFFFGLFIVF